MFEEVLIKFITEKILKEIFTKMNEHKLKDDVIIEFTSKLRKKLGHQLVETTLFGSRARGDNTVHSDYDFLIIVKRKEARQKEIIYDLCTSILDKYNSLVSFLLYDKQEWQRKKKYPLGLNILKEGIRV